ncbi:MAG: AraC family transcriptional regulator [Thermoanaerobaculales bacterium]|jgi:AraC-like DNA-binding protein|nr:AraC family transcriptional regulator [Thermoanaerobaculales bacterium]
MHSTLTSWARLIWDALETYGIDGHGVFSDAGLDPAALRDPKGRYPLAAMQRLWQLAVERSGDPCFGLSAAAQWHPTTWHGLGYAWLASTTLEEAFRRFERYSAIISSAADVRLDERETVFRVVIGGHAGAPTEPPPAVVDAIAATVVHMCRLSAGPGFSPIAVELSHGGDGCHRRRCELFRAPIRYGAPEVALEVDRVQACHRLPRANAALAQANEKVIADYLAELRGGQVTARLRAQLVEELPSGSVSAAALAASLHMSRRTLQRRLRAEGVTFSEVLDRTRRELAERFIRDHELTLSEITFLLGFSEQSSFSRSFRRWTGLPPAAFRSRTGGG